MSSDLTNVTAETLLKVCPVGTRGPAGALSKLSVYEDGASITDLSRLRFGTIGNDFTGNPYSLSSEFETVLDTVIYIKAHTAGTKTYTVVLEDAAGNTLSKTFDITIEATGTPVVESSARLSNSAGPSGTGGLDLDNGTETGSTNSAAELRDLGSVTWTMQFAPITANGVNLRSVSVDYTSIAFKEEIAEAYTNGTIISNATASIGDVYAVERGGVYYLIKVAAINDVAANNTDNVIFDIKK